MLSYEVYKFLHVILAISFFASSGVVFFAAEDGVYAGLRKKMKMLHGISVLLLLVAGFGLKARLGMQDWPLWLILKIAIWLSVAILSPSLSKRLPASKKPMGYTLILLLGFTAVFLAVFKPFMPVV